MWRYQKTFTRYPSNSKTNVKNRCPELGAGAGAGIGPVTPANQRKDQDVMLRLLKSMETIGVRTHFAKIAFAPRGV